MPTQRRLVLVTLLAVTLGLLLLDAHGSPRLMIEKMRAAVHDLRGDSTDADTAQG